MCSYWRLQDPELQRDGILSGQARRQSNDCPDRPPCDECCAHLFTGRSRGGRWGHHYDDCCTPASMSQAVLDPGEFGFKPRRHAEFPASVETQFLVSPIPFTERWIADDCLRVSGCISILP